MSVRALLAAIVVMSVPIAVNGEPHAPQQKPAPQENRTCAVRPESGSRINAVRTCRSASEREPAPQEHRQVIDRAQANKVSFGR